MSELASCGLDCQACEYRTKNCPGCQASGGTLAWGECGLAKCCMSKKLEHCGKCDEFPCEKLKAFSFDKAHGDNGRRIENLRTAK